MKHMVIALTIAALAVPAMARDSLGVFAGWGAFRDPETPRCYAIARPERTRAGDWEPFASIGNWPGRNLNGQVHFRLRREMAEGDTPILTIGDQRFELTGRGPDAWAMDARGDAAIVAAMRSGTTMRIAARSARHGRFTEDYSLRGAATAIDAAALGCAHL
ncbi:hypothetical protein [Parasphingopyxis marina]|uniref:Mlr4354 like protein n=1 Tax=Parasphingopyxis marina TaxID=2761622 RepID=A0A842HUP7_9SPHN|nr:hypothetical protein [Parasphingopyxis marina]MBC2776147.1 hypothetical protein [Parasphingopyxis marina]